MLGPSEVRNVLLTFKQLANSFLWRT